MAKKKTLKQAASTEKKPTKLAETLVGSANEIWLAGLGAFAKAQTEGKKIYDKLIDEGKDFEKLFKSVPQKAVSDVKSSVSSTVSSAKKRAADSWDKLEDVFEKRVEKSLKSLGVPTNNEIGVLIKRIDTLTQEVAKMAKSSGNAVKSKVAQSAVAAEKAVKQTAAKAKDAVENVTAQSEKVADKAQEQAATVKKVSKKTTKKAKPAVKKAAGAAKSTVNKVAKKKTTKKTADNK